MSKKTKNRIKAAIYVIQGIIIVPLSVLAVVLMYYSSTFLPVYIDNTYVLSNQVLRYTLYAALVIVALISAWLCNYGTEYLLKVFCKSLRKRR